MHGKLPLPTTILFLDTPHPGRKFFPRYLPFTLPATTGFTNDGLDAIPQLPRYQRYDLGRIPPSSSLLPQIIAVGQLFVSSRQLYLNYNGSLHLHDAH